MIPTAEFPTLPESAVKIASEWRYEDFGALSESMVGDNRFISGGICTNKAIVSTSVLASEGQYLEIDTRKCCLSQPPPGGKQIWRPFVIAKGIARPLSNHALVEAIEQRHFYANNAKTEMRDSCLKHLKNEVHACKTRSETASISSQFP